MGVLEENKVSIHAIEKIASIDIKKYEKCILAFSDKYQIPFVTYNAEELSTATGDFEVSEFVKALPAWITSVSAAPVLEAETAEEYYQRPAAAA